MFSFSYFFRSHVHDCRSLSFQSKPHVCICLQYDFSHICHFPFPIELTSVRHKQLNIALFIFTTCNMLSPLSLASTCIRNQLHKINIRQNKFLYIMPVSFWIASIVLIFFLANKIEWKKTERRKVIKNMGKNQLIFHLVTFGKYEMTVVQRSFRFVVAHTVSIHRHTFESFKPIAKSFHLFLMWNLEILACSLRQTVLWIFQGEFTLFITFQTLKTFRILEHLARCPDKF